MAMLCLFHRSSMCRPGHCALMRSELLDLTTIISATACHQSNYVEPYSRCTWPLRVNTSDSPVDRYRDKKVWTRGLSWHPSGPRTPGDDLDANRADTRCP